MMSDAPPQMRPDAAAIEADLRHFYGRFATLGVPCWFELRAFTRGGSAHASKFRPDDMGIALAVEWAVTMNSLGRNVYGVRNAIRDDVKGSASDADIIAAFFLWADCDDDGSTETVKRFDGPRPNAIVRTGRTPGERVHTYWELEEPCLHMPAWGGLQRAIAAHFGSDDKVVNPSRIMRIAGTVTYPDEKKRERGYTSEVAGLRVLDREPLAFDRALRVWPERTNAAIPPAGEFAHGGMFAFDAGAAPLDRERARIQALSGSEWHDSVIRLVASYVAKGLADAEIHALTDPLTLAGYTVEQTRREVQVAIDGARRKGWTPEAPQYAEPERVDWDAPQQKAAEPSKLEWFDDIEPSMETNYIVKGVLDAEAMSVCYGASNSGKTFFVLDLSYHVATGQPWRGRRVAPGGVLYLAAEGGRGIANRISALKKRDKRAGVRLALRRAGLDLLRSQADLQHIVDLANEVRDACGTMDLLVIDTLSRVIAGGDENSAQDMTAFIRNVDALRHHIKCHVLIVHHTGKDAARGARGHSSLRAATDTEIEVSEDEGVRTALVTKQRDHIGGEDFAFKLESVSLGFDAEGDEVTSAVVETLDSGEAKERRDRRKGLGKNARIILDTYDQMIADGMGRPNPAGVGFPDPGRFMAVSADELRRLSQGRMMGSDPGKLFRQAWEALADGRGLVGLADNLAWVTDRPAKS